MRLIGLCLLALLMSACVKEDMPDNTQEGNVEALWKIIDEHYCFLDYKNKEYGLDWDQVHEKYLAQARGTKLSTHQTFELLAAMLAELRDGHVNLSTAADYGRYWAWKDDYKENFYDTLQRKYLGTDYRIAGALKYKRLDDNVGYIYYGSFSSAFSESNLDEVMLELMPCRGLIVDVRNNSGGSLTYTDMLTARFLNEETLLGYFQHKTGPGHSDFSDMQEQRLKPASGIRWQKKVAVLCNRSVFSAANEFVKYMKALPNVTIVGDKSGGGGGMPFSSELPNGWSVRFSACPMYDINKQHTEFGIDPDIKVDISDEDYRKGVDTILEKAREILK